VLRERDVTRDAVPRHAARYRRARGVRASREARVASAILRLLMPRCYVRFVAAFDFADMLMAMSAFTSHVYHYFFDADAAIIYADASAMLISPCCRFTPYI